MMFVCQMQIENLPQSEKAELDLVASGMFQLDSAKTERIL